MICILEKEISITEARFLHKNHIITLQEVVSDVFSWNNVTLIIDEINEYFIKTKQEQQSFIVIEISPHYSIDSNDEIESQYNFDDRVNFLEAEDEDLFVKSKKKNLLKIY